MKKEKLNISDLKIQSFVTSLSDAEKETIAGGSTFATGVPCKAFSQYHSFCHTCEFVCDVEQ
jgi:hypothetical protein